MVDDHLGSSRYLCGDVLTLADVCLFTTLIRFDLVYHVLFKCSKKKIIEYPNLHGYMRDIYQVNRSIPTQESRLHILLFCSWLILVQIPKVAETCNMGAIMDGYYKTLFPLNPGGIRPVMPSDFQDDTLLKPPNRNSLMKMGEKLQLSVSWKQIKWMYSDGICLG